MTKIEWTEETWNPLKGCRRCSPGCEHCYAERMAYRFSGPGMPYEGLVQIGKQGPHWTGKSGEGEFEIPLHWRKARRIFVCSMSDLFFEEHTDEQIAAVFGVMAACPQHTFQVLTKRPERAREWFANLAPVLSAGTQPHPIASVRYAAQIRLDRKHHQRLYQDSLAAQWPLPNVEIGISAENNKYLDDRASILIDLPAARRFISAEPLLEEISLFAYLKTPLRDECLRNLRSAEKPGLDWVIVGGESGPGARRFDIGWARSIVKQCRDANVPVFVKQLGALPLGLPSCAGCEDLEHEGEECGLCWDVVEVLDGKRVLHLRDKKGGDMTEWPEDLRVREMPR